MLHRLSNWLQAQRAWKNDHVRTWHGLTSLDENGVSQFQRNCLLAIESLPLSLEFKQMGTSEAYFVSLIPNTNIEIFLYIDGAQVVGDHNIFRAEEWDFRTPDDLIQALTTTVSGLAHAT